MEKTTNQPERLKFFPERERKFETGNYPQIL
jgi:hypothetical protein